MKSDELSGDQPRRRFADQSLLVVRDELPGVIGEIFNARLDDRAAMNANHPAGFAEFVEVAPYGLQGDAEMSGKILDCDPSRLAQEGDDLGLPLARSRSWDCHATPPRRVQTLRLNAIEMRKRSPR